LRQKQTPSFLYPPLALKGIYGEAADKWFKFSARIGEEGFSFDKKNNHIIPTGNNAFDDLNQRWDQHAEGFKEEDLWMEGDDGEDDEFGGFAIDLGVIDLEARDGRVTILNDDSASVGTTRAPLPPGFRDEVSHMEEDEVNEDSLMRDDDSANSGIVVLPATPPVSTEDLIQKFLNDPSLLQQLQLAQQAQTATLSSQALISTPTTVTTTTTPTTEGSSDKDEDPEL
jgi:hypothetical protein